jgi:hypothetical protein
MRRFLRLFEDSWDGKLHTHLYPDASARAPSRSSAARASSSPRARRRRTRVPGAGERARASSCPSPRTPRARPRARQHVLAPAPGRPIAPPRMGRSNRRRWGEVRTRSSYPAGTRTSRRVGLDRCILATSSSRRLSAFTATCRRTSITSSARARVSLSAPLAALAAHACIRSHSATSRRPRTGGSVVRSTG